MIGADRISHTKRENFLLAFIQQTEQVTNNGYAEGIARVYGSATARTRTLVKDRYHYTSSSLPHSALEADRAMRPSCWNSTISIAIPCGPLFGQPSPTSRPTRQDLRFILHLRCRSSEAIDMSFE